MAAERTATSDSDLAADAYSQLARKAAQQAAVAELGRLALAGAQIQELMDDAVELAAESLGTGLAALLMPDQTGELLVWRASAGWDESAIEPVPITLDSQIGTTFLRGEPSVVTDLATDERFPAATRRLVRLGLTSAVAAPIRGQERPLGVLVAHSRSVVLFSDDDVLFLRGLANVLSAAIAHETVEAARRRTERQLELLAEASNALSGSLDPEVTLKELARVVVPELADWCIVHLAAGDQLVRVAAAHKDPALAETAAELNRPLEIDGATAMACVYRTGQPKLASEVTDEILVESVRPESLDRIKAMSPRSAMCVPLVAHGAVLGTTTLVRADSDRSYDEADLRFAEELGRRAGLAVDNARVHHAERRGRERAERLQRVTALLAAATTLDGVTEVVMGEVTAASGAVAGLVGLLDSSRTTVEVLAFRGYPAESIERWETFPLDADLPMSEAIRTGEPVFCSSSEERNERYPALQSLTDASHALAVLPLLGHEGPMGGLSLSFAEPREFAPEEHPFLQALANQAAQALERARLAEAFERQGVQFRSVLEQMPSGVIIVEAPSGKLILGNRQVSNIWRRPFSQPAWAGETGYKAFTVEGKPIGAHEWPLARAIRTGEVVVNELIQIARGDGTRGITAVSASPVRAEGGEIVAGVVVFSDVTEEVNARQEAERRAEAAQALAFVADGVCLVDHAGIVRLWNRAAEQATNVPAGDIVGKRLEDLLRGWGNVTGRVPVASSAGSVPQAATVPLELPGGERWLAIVGVAFEEGVVYAFRDVTEERQLETMKSDFIATVSHELRTPLAAVYGAATTLRQRSSLDPDERELLLAMIEEQAERLSRIVNEILIASRLDTGELQIQLETVNAAEITTQVVEVARRGVPGFELVLTAEPDLPPVVADPDRLRQVLGNLIENAIKYSGESTRVEIKVERGRSAVRFVVRDSGLGIAAGEHDRIFEKFYRVDAAMTGGVSGTGLGLYIVRELVERMDGRIWVRSTIGEGSTFSVELPWAASELA